LIKRTNSEALHHVIFFEAAVTFTLLDPDIPVSLTIRLQHFSFACSKVLSCITMTNLWGLLFSMSRF